MIESLLNIDVAIEAWINQTATHPWLDVFFENVTDLHKVPAVAVSTVCVLLFFSIRKYKTEAWRPVLGLILAVALSDVIAYRLIKKNVERPRPFQSESLSGVRKLTDGSGNSFPSNHAANCTAASVILAMCFPRRRYFFYGFAAIVGYSRIYLGVHYPSDVLAGALVGLMAGYGVAFFTVLQLKHLSASDA